jgi:hypothetical protein
MARPTTPSFYDVFGGLNEESGSEIGNYECREMENLYIINRGQELQRRKGTAILTDWDEDGIIDGLEWIRIDDTDYLITVWDGTVYDALSASGTDFLLGGPNRFSSWPTVNGTQLARKLYLGNGVDQNVRWDGTSVRQVMPEKPEVSGTVLSVSGANIGATESNHYKITFLSYDGISSEPSDVVAGSSLSDLGMALSPLPISQDGDCTGRQIWRTVGAGTTYYLIGTVTGNVDTVFVDSVLDEDVDTLVELETATVRFPPCRYLVNHQERLVGAFSDSDEGDTRTVYLSNFQVPETCPLIAPLDAVDDPVFGARIPVEDTVTALETFGNVLLVWTAGACYRLEGDNPNNWTFNKWIDNGCVSHRSVASHRNTLVWLGPDGVYLAEGWGQVSRISDPIREEFEDFTAIGMAGGHGFIWQDRYYLCFNDRAFYYDLVYRTWGKLDPWKWQNTVVSRNTGQLRERLFATDDLTAQVWELETGKDDNGEAIQVRWASKDKDLGHFGREKRVHRVIATFKAGTGEATVTLYRSGELLDTFVHDLSTVARTGSEISTLDDRASEGARDEYFRLEVESSTEAADFRLLRCGFHYTLCS